MTMVLAPFRLLFKLYFGIVFYISLILMFPAFWITTRKEKWYPACFKLKLLWARILQVSLLIFIKREFKGDLPKPPYIVVSNHSSYLDIVFMYRIIKDPFIFLGKRELLKWPLFNLFFKTMDIAVDRKNRVAAARTLIRARNYIDDGYCITIFPEATIPDHVPVMKRFKDGAFKLALEKQVPIVPVTFINNWKLFSDPKHTFGPASPGVSRVVIHEPIYTHQLTEEDLISLRQQVYEIVKAPLEEENKATYESHQRGNR